MPRHFPLTVVLPARNAETTIGSAISSILNQSYTNFELWVLENGSSDQTAAIARSFPDPRIKVFELGVVGFEGALQYAIENSPSEWLARMDADDLMFPDRLKTQMELIEQTSELVFVGTAFAMLTPFGHIFERLPARSSREVDVQSLSRGRFFADPSTIFNRRTALQVGLDPEFTSADLPFLFRLLTRGKGWEIAKALHLYRIQPGSMSRNLDFYRQNLRVREKYAPETAGYEYYRRQVPPVNNSPWSFIAGLELLARDAHAVRQVANFIEPDNIKTAQWLRKISSWGPIGYAWYRLYDRSEHHYRRRRDWERLFSPLLENAGVSDPGKASGAGSKSNGAYVNNLTGMISD